MCTYYVHCGGNMRQHAKHVHMREYADICACQNQRAHVSSGYYPHAKRVKNGSKGLKDDF